VAYNKVRELAIVCLSWY